MLTVELPRRPDGRRRQHIESVRGTKRDAQKRLSQLLYEVDSRVFADGGSITFDELADCFLAARKTRVVATTYQLYERHLSQHIRPAIGSLAIGAIRQQHVEYVLTGAFDHSRTRRKGKALRGGTLRNILVTLRACLQHAVRNDWLTRNVAQRVETPSRESEREPVLFDVAKVRRMLDAAIGTEIEAIVAFAIATGARRGEICGLRWCDVDLNSGRYTIRRSAANIGRDVVYKQPKSKHSRRTDVLPPFLLELLRGHHREQKRRWLAMGLGRLDDEACVFTRADATPWNPNELSRQFSRLVRRKKLGAIRFHDLRHGHASLAFAAGVPLRTISESLGHSSIGITSSIYIHLLDEGRSDKAERLDAYLRDAVGAS
jgi:integrase